MTFIGNDSAIVFHKKNGKEAAEVISGINILDKTGDAENLKEELGDLLLP